MSAKRNDVIPNNQAARDLQRERQKRERAQMLTSEDPDCSQSTQDLFNAPVRVTPSIEDHTSIEIRKTLGLFDHARPYLMDNHGTLQRRLLGVDPANASPIKPPSMNVSGPSGDSAHRSSNSISNTSGSGSGPVPPPKSSVAPSHSASTSHSHRREKGTGDRVDSLFKHIPGPNSQTNKVSSSSSSLYPATSKALSPTLNQLQNSISSIWNVPTPVSPLPQRKTLSTTTLPITFVNTNSINSFTTTSSEIGDLPSRPQLTKTNTQSSNNQPSNTTSRTNNNSNSNQDHPKNSSSSSSSIISAVKGEVNNTSASLGASTTQKSSSASEQHTFKKPLERFDSRLELDSMIREMTDVSSPLSAILPKDSPKKVITPRRSSRGDDRTNEVMDGINDLKHNPSPVSITGMNSSSSSSGSDSSDSDSDSDSSTASEKTPFSTPVKATSNTTRSPTERDNWSLATFVGGIRKENALIGATSSTSSETKAATTSSSTDTIEHVSESSNTSSLTSKSSSELNVSSSSSSSASSAKSNTNATTILETTKALNKSSSAFIKPSVPPSKPSKTESSSVSHSKSGSKSSKPSGDSKRKVAPVPSKPVSSLQRVSSALKKHKDPALSGSSSEDEAPPPKPKDKVKDSPSKAKVSSKRPATTTTVSIETEPASKKLRRSTRDPSPIVSPPEKDKEKSLPDKGKGDKDKSKSHDRNKNDMIGRLFRPKKEKEDITGSSSGKGGDKNGSPAEEKMKPIPKLESAASNHVSAKDAKSSEKDKIASISSSGPTKSKSNGDLKSGGREKGDSASKVTVHHKSKRSESPVKNAATTLVKEKEGVKTSSANQNHANSKLRRISPSPPPKHKKVSGGISPTLKSKKRSSGIGNSSSSSDKATKNSVTVPAAVTELLPITISATQIQSKSKTKIKKEVGEVSSGGSKGGAKNSGLSSEKKSKSSSSKSGSLKSTSGPLPPIIQPQPQSSNFKEISISKEKEKKISPTPPPPSQLLVQIPFHRLPKIPKFCKLGENPPPGALMTKKAEKKEEGRVKNISLTTSTSSSIPSLVGSSVEEVTESTHAHNASHNVPNKVQIQRSSDGHGHGHGSENTKAPTSKDKAGSPNSRKKSRKRSRSHSSSQKSSHASSKKSKLKEIETEVDIKDEVETEKIVACELSSTSTTPSYSVVPTAAAKTPPDPPDSSLNPTHSSSPTVALTQQPQYLGYFERVEAQEDFFTYDQEYYLNEAKRLKHKADKEESGVTQILTYMDATLHFILHGIVIERMMGKKEAFAMYKDTLSLIRHIGGRPRKRLEDLQEIKLLVLNYRIQALLALSLYKIRIRETTESSLYLGEVFVKGQTAYEYMPPPMTHSPHTSLGTPSPHSPALSPAGSAPSSSSGIGSASSQITTIQSPHSQSQQTYVITKHLYQHLYRHYSLSSNLILAHDLWESGDTTVERHHLQEFFISIDRSQGPITLHSSLLDLVRYVRCGLKILNQNLLES